LGFAANGAALVALGPACGQNSHPQRAFRNAIGRPQTRPCSAQPRVLKTAHFPYFEIAAEPRPSSRVCTATCFPGHSKWMAAPTGFGGRMSKEDEYRRYAAALLDLAKRASNDHDKKRLLVISEAWLNLADKLSRMAGRRQATERLFREIFS